MQIFLTAAAAAALCATFSDATLDGRFVKSLYKAHQLDVAVSHLVESSVPEPLSEPHWQRPFELKVEISESREQSHRHLEDQMACDQAFMTCMPNQKCIGCFSALQSEGIDWASVAPGTPCPDVVDFLIGGSHCTNLKEDADAIKVFCSTFDVCVAWYDDNDDYAGGGSTNNGGGKSTNSTVDCTQLTECNWEGMHRGFLGDGICHENYPGCYNTAICNFDGGDCCEDTCVDKTSFAECGHDGFACRYPKSSFCDPALTLKCENADDKKKVEPDPVTCSSGESKYRLVMFDSFGDGWDTTVLTLSPNDKPSKKIFTGSLKNGSQGIEYICLSDEPMCYNIDVSGGVWGNEVSWEVRPLGEGTKALADGGAPMTCTFPVAGQSCERTCTGKPNVDPSKDADYKTYKDLYTCIQDKCLIQVGACMADTRCSPCFAEDAPEYCFANDNFNAVINCGLCQCTDKYSEFCSTKTNPGAVIPDKIPDEKAAQKPCTAAETLQGSNAVLTFAKCTNFDQVGMMVTDFDENHFGALDTFEACAHSFQNDPSHGGKTALFCMQILADAIDNPTPNGSPDAPAEAISTLAGLLYHDAEDFCECAKNASSDCPFCPSFMRFKTLLYESLDACKALDEIDCDAWAEFYPKCKTNLETKFTNVDFRNKDQCDFVKDKCGGAGPFPAFRKLDCDRELQPAPWAFYLDYKRQCLSGDNGKPPSSVPSPTGSTPTSPPSQATTPMPTAAVKPPDNKQPSSNGDGDGNNGGKPYYPSDDDLTPGSKKAGKNASKKTGTSHFWRNIIIMGVLFYGAYWYYKRHHDNFSFVRYRQAPQRNFGSDSDMMMSGSLTGSSTFEPPSLPPPPSAMNHGYPQGGGYP